MTDDDKSQVELARSAAAGDRASSLILELWQRTRIDWSFASDRIADVFRRERGLASVERRFVAETLYGMIRHARRIDESLEAGGMRRSARAPDRARMIAYLVLEGGLDAEDAARHEPGVDWTAARVIDARLEALSDAVQRIGRRWSLPEWLAASLVRDYRDEADALAAALAERAPMTLRANTLAVANRDELASNLSDEGIATHPGRWSPTALIVDTRTNLFSLKAFRAGAFEAQDEGSQLLAELVAPPPKGRIVDYCAGAGGKTLALAAALGGRGRVVACDVDRRKLTELRRRAKRAGAHNIHAALLPRDGSLPGALEPYLGRASRVLVDAPCTGTGALRRNPEARWRLGPDDAARFAATQERICRDAAMLVAPGGRLVYATCSLLEAENQAVVDRFLAAHPGFEPVAVKEIWGGERAAPLTGESETHLSLLPHRHGTDGFFAAVLRRRRQTV